MTQQQDRQQLLTPVGRMVQGHPFEEQTKDMTGKQLTTKDGQPRVKYFVAVAIPKNDPAWPAFWKAIWDKGAASWPGGQYNRAGFAWKVADGDSPDNQGKTGFAGCWIVKASGSFAPRVYNRGGTSLITEKTGIKRGDYVRLYISVTSNQDTAKPGMYLNPQMVELIGYGEEIQNGPDGAQVFGGAPVTALPPGASATPTAPSTTIAAPGTPAAPAAAAPPLPGSTAAAASPPPPGGTAAAASPPPPGGPASTSVVTPAADILGNPAAPAPASPAAPAAPAPAPRIPVKTMTAKAGATPYAEFIAKGWTDPQLVEHGYMTVQ